MTTKNCKGTGTIRENRVGKECPLMHSQDIKKKERGPYDSFVQKMVKWNDTCVVTIASNYNQVWLQHK